MEKHQTHNVLKADYADPKVDQLLKHTVRNQLESLLKAKLTTAQRQQALTQSFVNAMALTLGTTVATHAQLTAAFEAMYDQAVQSMSMAELSEELLTRQYISPTGLVMSPYNCRHTIKDIYRIQGYARGIDKAIRGMLSHKDSITILYPACGPFAPLLLPLLSYYKDQNEFNHEQIKVLFVDTHPGAIVTLRQLINDLQLGEFVADIIEEDATVYEPQESIDLLVLEAMQHGFTREGQLAIAKHLVKFLTLDGWMIPRSVSIKGMMVHGETEFNQQWKDTQYCHSDNLNNSALQERIELGELMRIDKSVLLKMEEIELEDDIRVVAANRVTLPTGFEDMPARILAVYAQINTFDDEGLDQYDSGITHPRPDMNFYVDAQPKELEHTHFVANSGDTVQFYYQLSGMPGFVPVKV
ncbi:MULTISPECIES: hypothetical protein [unclassified Pseudoalteromonas]|uniref:hypothetical protein n=1 Tax=unclassified Pseudoalteromonas TaxID=194690 RepID=UPI00209771F9|nr:hypothetical protein [Pseudoalteromonas sp. XMcav2-N]MCO7188987.1 hypothetical protein [Pseudoalteromonas sp. XMcav2-N]